MPLSAVGCSKDSAQLTTARRLLTLVPESSAETPHVAALVALLRRDVDAVDTYLNSQKKSPLNEAVMAADAARDETLRQAGGFIRGGQNHFDPQIADAFTLLYNIMERHQFGARYKAYAEQSAVINSMLLEMEQPEALAAIATCGADPLINKIRTDQVSFEEAIIKRIDAIDADQPRLAALIKPVRDGIRDFLAYFASRERLDPAKYAGLVVQINAMITEVSTTVRARRTRKGNTAAQVTPAEIPEPATALP